MELDPTNGASATAKGLASQVEEGQDVQSLGDTDALKRPRDAHTIHLILHQYGVSAYQERVPLQLMDFAYRYTSSILQDALHLTNESYAGVATGPGAIGTGKSNDASILNVNAIRLAIRSRTHYQYNPNISKDFYMEIMQEKNKIALPPVSKESNLQLPPEQYILMGRDWEMGESFDLMDTDIIQSRASDLHGETFDRDAEVGEDVEGGTVEDLFGPIRDDENEDGMDE